MKSLFSILVLLYLLTPSFVLSQQVTKANCEPSKDSKATGNFTMIIDDDLKTISVPGVEKLIDEFISFDADVIRFELTEGETGLIDRVAGKYKILFYSL